MYRECALSMLHMELILLRLPVSLVLAKHSFCHIQFLFLTYVFSLVCLKARTSSTFRLFFLFLILSDTVTMKPFASATCYNLLLTGSVKETRIHMRIKILIMVSTPVYSLTWKKRLRPLWRHQAVISRLLPFSAKQNGARKRWSGWTFLVSEENIHSLEMYIGRENYS